MVIGSCIWIGQQKEGESMFHKTYSSYGLFLTGLLLASRAQAQATPGWEVCWGNECGVSAVPLSPLLSVLISLILAAVAYVLIRRRSKGLASLAAIGLVLAGVSGYEMQKAWASLPDFEVSNPSGREFEACGSKESLWAWNSTGQTVRIQVRASGEVGTYPLMHDDCRATATLPPGEQCNLPCREPG